MMVCSMLKENKIKLTEEIRDSINESSVIGIIDMHKTPSRQLQQIRKELREKAIIRMIQKSVLIRALDGVKDEKIKQIEDHMPKQPTLILSDLAPFKLYALVKGLKFKTFAKAGDVSKEDIWVFAGPTNLLAGPAISEFQHAGIPAGIEAGKIAIKKDKLVVKAGEPISAEVSNILRKLNIEPMHVMLNIVAIYEEGNVYTEDSLKLVLEFPGMIPKAFNDALNLSVSICYPTKQNIKYLLSKAFMEANALSGLVKTEDKQEEKIVEESEESEKTEDVGTTTEETSPTEEVNKEKIEENKEV